MQKTLSLIHVGKLKLHLKKKKTLDPTARSPAAGKSIINLFVDDLFGTGGKEMEQRLLARLRKYFQVGSEDSNDVAFIRQRLRWTHKIPKRAVH